METEGGQVKLEEHLGIEGASTATLLATLRRWLSPNQKTGEQEVNHDPATLALKAFEEKCSWNSSLTREVSEHPLCVALQAFEQVGGIGQELAKRAALLSIEKLEEIIGNLPVVKPFTDLCAASDILKKEKPGTNKPELELVSSRVEVSISVGKFLLACQSGAVCHNYNYKLQVVVNLAS